MGPWQDHRTIIDRELALTARAMARAGRDVDTIAQTLAITPHVAALFIHAPVQHAHPQPPDVNCQYGNAQSSDVPLEEGETRVPPQRCPTCAAPIEIVPCRACRMRATPRVRPPRRD